MSNYSYKYISDFGSNEYSPINNPLTYCIGDTMDQRFTHGEYSETSGQNTRACQLFMSQHCAGKWDEFCELASNNKSKGRPISVNCHQNNDLRRKLTSGEILIMNTAAEKYLTKMHNARKEYEPFDPNVATSPMISYWVGSCGIPEYSVDPKKIDKDILMDKILENPNIVMNILINIYNTMKRHGTLSELKRTKLGHFYNSHEYFKSKGGV